MTPCENIFPPHRQHLPFLNVVKVIGVATPRWVVQLTKLRLFHLIVGPRGINWHSWWSRKRKHTKKNTNAKNHVSNPLRRLQVVFGIKTFRRKIYCVFFAQNPLVFCVFHPDVIIMNHMSFDQNLLKNVFQVISLQSRGREGEDENFLEFNICVHKIPHKKETTEEICITKLKNRKVWWHFKKLCYSHLHESHLFQLLPNMLKPLIRRKKFFFEKGFPEEKPPNKTLLGGNLGNN